MIKEKWSAWFEEQLNHLLHYHSLSQSMINFHSYFGCCKRLCKSAGNAVWAKFRGSQDENETKIQRWPEQFKIFFHIIRISNNIWDISMNEWDRYWNSINSDCWWKIAQVPDHMAATWWDMWAVCCMVLVDDNFHYLLIPSDPLCDVSKLLFKVFKNPCENAVWAKFKGPITRTEPKFKK